MIYFDSQFFITLFRKEEGMLKTKDHPQLLLKDLLITLASEDHVSQVF